MFCLKEHKGHIGLYEDVFFVLYVPFVATINFLLRINSATKNTKDTWMGLKLFFCVLCVLCG